jgi:hypothetical protein
MRTQLGINATIEPAEFSAIAYIISNLKLRLRSIYIGHQDLKRRLRSA